MVDRCAFDLLARPRYVAADFFETRLGRRPGHPAPARELVLGAVELGRAVSRAEGFFG